MKENKLTEGNLLSAVLWFTLPFLLSNLLQTLYGTVDTLIIGKLGSTSGVSAVACGAQLLALFTYLAFGLSSGGTVLVGQCIGSKDYARGARLVGNLIISFAVVGLVLMALALGFSPVFLSLINVPGEAMAEAVTYMHICSFGIPLIIGYNIVCALLRAMGDSKTPLIFVAVASVINIAGDLLLTGALKMGVTGVAIATVGAQGLSFLFSLVYITRKGLAFDFSRQDIRFDRKTTGDIFRIGVPMGLQSILINISFMFITAIINSMGLAASAAMGIGDKIVNFSFMPQTAFSASIAVVVAQNYGAGRMDRARRAVKYAIAICVSLELPFLLLCQIAPALLPGLFSNDSQVIALTGQYMQAYSIDALLTAISFNMSAMLNGCGRTTFNMVQNLLTTFLVRIPVTWFFARMVNTNLFLIGCAAPASTLVSVILLLGFIRFAGWETPMPKTADASSEE